MYANPWGSYLIYFDTTEDAQGADIDVDKCPITVAAPYLSEFHLDIRAIDRKRTVSGSRGRVHTAIDWEEPVTLDLFARVELSK